jgi:hypothetical protein
MKICFLCKRQLSHSDTYYDISKLLREHIAIPIRMNKNDVICEDRYQKLKDEYKPQQTSHINTNVGGVEVRGVEFHDKALTPEEMKAMYERGPPGVADSTTHVIGHKDEKDGYLWIDGKKVKKDNPEDLK